ncbi:MAG: DNA primase, partial [Candidatus Riflebacteria bacterium]|nr:DNA primase [Candidatus Riflebacteria bacterium]
MAYSFPDELKDEIRERVDILQVISESVRLRKSGSSFIGLCPFHKEKTPSFSVVPAKRIYYCFGCHEGGDIFKFLMKKENLSFPVVIEKLAIAAGIDLSRYERSSATTGVGFARLYEANSAAQAFFISALEKDARALEYLKGRGLTPAISHQFSLGYAPDAWTALYDHLKHGGFNDSELITAGLVRKGERPGCYDYFRNRVIFPIHDEQGRVVAFGGRVLSDEKPKYLNSPETPIYSKGRLLFNMHRVLRAPELPAVVLVEGYMDVVGLAQGGVANVVATLGTALTEPHIRKLSRVTKTLFLAYDPDEAGVRATMRSLELLESSGLVVRVLRLPDGLDPDELVLGRGKQAWDKVLDQAVEVEDFLFDHVVVPFDLSKLAQRREAFRELKKTYPFLPSPESRERFIRRVSDRLELGDDVVRSTFTTPRGRVLSDDVLTSKPKEAMERPSQSKERFLLACFLADPSLYERYAGKIVTDTLEDPKVRRVMELLPTLAPGPASLQDRLLDCTESEEEMKSFVAGLSVSFILPEESLDRAVRECLGLLHRDQLVRQRNQLMAKIRGSHEPA